jgi:N-formylglutamate deformylase
VLAVHSVIHIPHASTRIPSDLRPPIVLDEAALAHELLVMTDRYTDELFEVSGALARTIAFPVSRLVVDPERFPDDADEPMAQKGMGVIYERTASGELLRQHASPSERSALMDRYYHPHHAALESAVQRGLQEDGRCLLLDGHSFPSTALPYEFDQSPNRPDICIGADEFHSPGDLVELARGLFQSVGWHVEVNRPFAGAIVPLAFYQRDKRVESLMIEVNRGVYMDESTGIKRSNFNEVRRAVLSVIGSLLQRV